MLACNVGYHMQSYAHGLLHKDSKHLGIRSDRSTVLFFSSFTIFYCMGKQLWEDGSPEKWSSKVLILPNTLGSYETLSACISFGVQPTKSQ